MSKSEYFFKVLEIIVYGLYIVGLLGLWSQSHEYYEFILYYFRLFIGAVLVITFFPYYNFNEKITSYHKRLAYYSGFFLLSATTITQFKNNTEKLIDYLDIYYLKIKNSL